MERWRLKTRIQLADLNHPVATGALANQWRDRLSTSVPGDPAVRDRDLKLLAWLEYVEMLRDSRSTTTYSELTLVYQAQLACKAPNVSIIETEDEPMSGSERGAERLDRPHGRTASGQSAAGDPPSERRRNMEVWRKYGPRWETWATGWSVRGDP